VQTNALQQDLLRHLERSERDLLFHFQRSRDTKRSGEPATEVGKNTPPTASSLTNAHPNLLHTAKTSPRCQSHCHPREGGDPDSRPTDARHDIPPAITLTPWLLMLKYSELVLVISLVE